ncbi:hypothetical protein HYPSUDRAFT_125971 [Hypholoma sublateritium FD-334 SS-4]|uniref:XRRM domain-containing protein n=1 Tax=Hypholoma sublateritium (strain FD-334 SS-4) TaxID=945553 RepID=A0A0D2LNT6_HYPSF|nr:hypothetical protein HYPSUDRAFT_125971 [Hypholoma sublateritium FD-334 SS-4]
MEGLADLVVLALSDHTLWMDVDLRRKIDWSVRTQQREEESNTEEIASNDVLNDDTGYIPLTHLLRHSSIFLQSSSSPSFIQHPETTYVKALRAHAVEFVDVRLAFYHENMQTGQGEANNWYHSSGQQTGYEIRRKYPAIIGGSNFSEYGKADWDRLTIYVENIPVQYRSLPGTLKLVKTLLAYAPSPSSLRPRIQNIIFPRHHRDQSTSLPVCKGFALVTLTFLQDVNYILRKCPWETLQAKADSKATENRSQVFEDVTRFGFRSTSKERWDALKADYLLYRQRLIEEINEAQGKEQVSRRQLETTSLPVPESSVHVSSSHDRNEKHSVKGKGKDVHIPAHAAAVEAPKIHANSLYPPGCLVFVRHLHPDTNKTTLRALFAHAWSRDAGASSSGKPTDGIDYLDFMKGMDSCHIRLSTPVHAQKFVAYFSAHPTRQTSGLDNSGVVSEASDATIAPELVFGKREEVYWEKVPEKVRRQAVDKALKLMDDGNGHAADPTSTNDGNSYGQKKRKR